MYPGYRRKALHGMEVLHDDVPRMEAVRAALRSELKQQLPNVLVEICIDYHSSIALTFEDIGLDSCLLRSVIDYGLEAPTGVQKAVCKPVMAGHNTIVCSPAGTGKTVAVVIAILNQIVVNKQSIQVLLLTPTGEVARRAYALLLALTQHMNTVCDMVYGGCRTREEVSRLRSHSPPHVLVGTPGRILDHQRRGAIDVTTVQTVILDEADEILGRGFREQLTSIMKHIDCPRLVVSSCTLPADLRQWVELIKPRSSFFCYSRRPMQRR